MIFLLVLVVIIVISILFTQYELFNAGDIEFYDFYGSKPGLFICIISGVHGNEPSGPYTLRNMLRAGEFKIAHGHLRVIPAANSWGLANNSRYQSAFGSLNPYGDINRNYTKNGGVDPTSQRILQLVAGADLILDIHDGYDFHCSNADSVGSSLSPTAAPLAQKIARSAVAEINSTALALPRVAKKCVQFMELRGESCKIPTTLACWAQQNARAYILAEITGQQTENQLPVAARDKQVRIIIKHILQEMR